MAVSMALALSVIGSEEAPMDEYEGPYVLWHESDGDDDPEHKMTESGTPIYDVTLELNITYRLPVAARTQREALAEAKSWLNSYVEETVENACCGYLEGFKIL